MTAIEVVPGVSNRAPIEILNMKDRFVVRCLCTSWVTDLMVDPSFDPLVD
jgi:hypothetical protein